jgi:hypothetical protein
MLTDFTFKDTGITVKIKKVSPMLAADISASMPAPEPPYNLVDYGDGKIKEENRQDPNFLSAVMEYQHKVFLLWRRMMILRAVVVEGEEWRAEVEEYRAFILRHTGKSVEEPEDLVVYVLGICLGSEEDLEELISAITRRSQPTREAVEAAKDSFRN